MRNKGKILIISEIHEFAINKLKEAGFEIEYLPNIPEKEIKNKTGDFMGLIVRSRIVNKNMIDGSSKLRFIARIGSGMENIDVSYANLKGIKCINSPEGNRDSLGEYVTGVILSLLHYIKKSDKELRQGLWKRRENIATELESKTVGIIGYGRMGSAVAERLRSFGTSIIAYDKYRKNFSNKFVDEVTLNDIFSKTDILTIHLPQNKETFYMVDDKFIKNFKNNIYLINTSRGKIVNTRDIVSNLKSGKIIGAALDVLEYESSTYETLENVDKEIFDYLTQSDNVILTPHIAGQSLESSLKHAKTIVNKIKLIA